MAVASYSIAEIAAHIGAEVHGDSALKINSFAPLAAAEKGQISFVNNSRYHKFLSTTKASALIVSPKERGLDLAPTLLVVNDPYLGYAKAASLFASAIEVTPGIHASVTIGEGCNIHPTARIAPQCVIENGVSIGANTQIGPGCVIGEGVTIGEDCRLWANVTLYHHVVLHHRVTIHSGAVIGADGFGFARDRQGWCPVPQLGKVILCDDVNIGANTTIDRGALGDTLIERGVKLDNQIQVGHNVRIGENTAIAACSGVSGSVDIGKNCLISGMVGFTGHFSVTDNVTITGMTVVSKSLTQPGVYSSGTAIEPHHTWRKNAVRFRQLDDMAKRIKQLEDKLEQLQQS